MLQHCPDPGLAHIFSTTQRPYPPRRRFLAALGLTPVVWAGLLSGCGGGDEDEDENTPTAQGLNAQEAAAYAVTQGVVGALCQYLTPHSKDLGTAGLRRLGQNSAIQAQDPFAIGSTTKAMTAMLAGRLVDQGRLQWQSPLEEMLPGLAPRMHPEYRAVTLHQLLAHRSGLMAFQSSADVQALLDGFEGNLPPTLIEQRYAFAQWVLAQPPIQGVKPGVDYAYSNAGYTVVGAILEAYNELAFEDLFTAQLSTPLGMTHPWRDSFTTADLPVVGHVGSAEHLTVFEQSDPLAQSITHIFAPAGTTLHLSGADYGAWLRWHMQALAGQSTPLASSYIAALRATNHGQYTMGWIAKKQQAVPSLVHDGSTMGFQSLVWVDLDGQGAGHVWANCTEVDSPTPWVSTVLINLLQRMGRYYRA